MKQKKREASGSTSDTRPASDSVSLYEIKTKWNIFIYSRDCQEF